jgi:hypothetical protein
MSESSKWVRSISFNKKNQADKERLKLIGKKSFSKYIKKLLDEEIRRKNGEKEVAVDSKNQSHRYDQNDNQEYYQKTHNNQFSKPLLPNMQKPQRNSEPKR